MDHLLKSSCANVVVNFIQASQEVPNELLQLPEVQVAVNTNESGDSNILEYDRIDAEIRGGTRVLISFS